MDNIYNCQVAEYLQFTFRPSHHVPTYWTAHIRQGGLGWTLAINKQHCPFKYVRVCFLCRVFPKQRRPVKPLCRRGLWFLPHLNFAARQVFLAIQSILESKKAKASQGTFLFAPPSNKHIEPVNKFSLFSFSSDLEPSSLFGCCLSPQTTASRKWACAEKQFTARIWRWDETVDITLSFAAYTVARVPSAKTKKFQRHCEKKMWKRTFGTKCWTVSGWCSDDWQFKGAVSLKFCGCWWKPWGWANLCVCK